jgi:DNA polymerase
MIAGDHSTDAAALAWLVSVGADEAIGDVPVDRFQQSSEPSARPAAPVQMPTVQMPAVEVPPVERPTPQPVEPTPLQPAARPAHQAPTGTVEDTATARELAAAASTLEELRDAIFKFDGLSLKATATNLVFADGNPQAKLMLIGEAPGAEEDRRGLPFVGAAGQLLDRMLAAIDHDRTNSYITNIVNWRPPGNRKPSPSEMALCQPFIERHIALVKPALILLLGDTAAKTLSGRSEGITRLRGKWCEWTDATSGAAIPMLPTFHPAFLLRSPSQKREAWIDLQAAKRKLAELGA